MAADTDAHLYLSTDRGLTWVQMAGPAKSAVTVIDCIPAAAPVCYLGTEADGIFETGDGGISFVRANNGLPVNDEGDFEKITGLALSADFAADSTLFATTWYKAAFKSEDRGKTWRQLDSGITTDNQANTKNLPHFRKLQVPRSQGNSVIFLAGFDGLFKSVNFGTSWTELETLNAGRVEEFAISPFYETDRTVAVVTQDAGAYLSKDAGLTWMAASQGLRQTHVWDIAFSPRGSSVATIMTISNRAFHRSDREELVWENVSLDRNRWLVAAGRRLGRKWGTYLNLPLNELRFPLQIVFASTFPDNPDIYLGTRYEGIYKSRDAGSSWSQLGGGPQGWVSSLVISPSYDVDQTIFAATILQQPASYVYRSRNAGRNWQRVGGDFDGALSNNTDADVELAISPNYGLDRTVMVGTANGLFITDDGGERWTKVTQPIAIGQGYVRYIAFSPNFQDDGTVFIAVHGKGLYKSVDKGRSFVPIENRSESEGYQFASLAFSPNYAADKTIYGRAYGELVKSIDSGETWSIVPRLVRYEDLNGTISFEGQWETDEDPGFSAATSRHTTHRGARVSLRFVGSGIAWIGATSSAHGIASVFIDGVFRDTVDLFSVNKSVMTSVFAVSQLDFGPHTITIEASGSKNPRSAGYSIDVDAFDVLP